jgi:hypothetical protein
VLTVKSIADMNAAIVANLHRIPRDVEAIVGIPRSGLLAASAIALHLQKPLTDVEGLCDGRVYRRKLRKTSTVRKVLLVDDTVLHGTAMNQAAAMVLSARPKIDVVRFAVYDSPVTPGGVVDLVCERVPGPRAFAWNLWKHTRLDRWCFDLDGVLCRDPEKDENDDGDRYLQFVRTAALKFKPTQRIGYIVTARLEKYRAETEAWLQRNGIGHGGLFMLDLPTKAARMERGNRASFKAERYATLTVQLRDEGRQKPTELFVESNNGQARKIAELTGKAVWCTDTQTFYPAAPSLVSLD